MSRGAWHGTEGCSNTDMLRQTHLGRKCKAATRAYDKLFLRIMQADPDFDTDPDDPVSPVKMLRSMQSVVAHVGRQMQAGVMVSPGLELLAQTFASVIINLERRCSEKHCVLESDGYDWSKIGGAHPMTGTWGVCSPFESFAGDGELFEDEFPEPVPVPLLQRGEERPLSERSSNPVRGTTPLGVPPEPEAVSRPRGEGIGDSRSKEGAVVTDKDGVTDSPPSLHSPPIVPPSPPTPLSPAESDGVVDPLPAQVTLGSDLHPRRYAPAILAGDMNDFELVFGRAVWLPYANKVNGNRAAARAACAALYAEEWATLVANIPLWHERWNRQMKKSPDGKYVKRIHRWISEGMHLYTPEQVYPAERGTAERHKGDDPIPKWVDRRGGNATDSTTLPQEGQWRDEDAPPL